MIENIDLDAIEKKVNEEYKIKHPQMCMSPQQERQACMKEAVHQALVLASEKAAIEWDEGDDGEAVTVGIDKQSILDVEKLII